MNGHSPLPWKFTELRCEDSRGMGYIADDNGTDIFHAGARELWTSENLANAALVVRAANSHDDLVAALERTADRLAELLRDLGGCDHSVGICCCDEARVVSDARAALAKARGET